jgi:hypothetical protein
MTRTATIELRDLRLATAIGSYGPRDVVPDAHILDLTLTISPNLMQVYADEMALGVRLTLGAEEMSALRLSNQ